MGYHYARSGGKDPNGSGFIISEPLMKDRSVRMRFGIDDFLSRYDPADGDIRGGSGRFRFGRVLEKAHDRAEESR